MRRLILRAVDWTSSIEASGAQLAGLFAATVILRNLLESISAGLLFPAPAFVFHFPIAYVFPMLGLTALMHMLSGYPLRRLLQLMVFAWTLTLLPPLLDFLLGSSAAIGYFPLDRSNASFFLLNFFNPAVELQGTTAGIRIEAAIGCVLAGLFSWAVADDRRMARGIGTTVLFAPVFLMFFTWPSLVYVLTMDLFPYAGTLQEYYQWHAATAPHLTGSLHYTVFLVDLIPVTLILAWFHSRLDPEGWRRTYRSAGQNVWTLAAPLAGTAWFLSSSRGILTFADAVSMTGALLAAVLILLSRHAGTAARNTMWGISILAALAVGWSTAALAMLCISVLMLPGPRIVSACLSGVAAFLVASSPAGLSWGVLSIPVMALCALAAVSRSRPAAAAGVLAVAAALVLRPPPPTSYTQYHRWLNLDISRNGRLDFTLPAARETAASGGDMLSLAKAEFEEGNPDRADWCYRMALSRGADSPDVYRLGLKLALSRGMEDEYDELMSHVLSDPELMEKIDVGGVMVSRATMDSDTLFIRRIMELGGPSPQLYRAFSTACAGSGDHGRAERYARAALSHPRAGAGEYAWAVHVAASTGGDYDSLFLRGMERFPGSVEIMEARLKAPLTAGRPPDREDLLLECLALAPASPGILRTAALWYASAGRPVEALEYAERAIAAVNHPDLALLRLACRTAYAAGDSSRSAAHALYGLKLEPDNAWFLEFLETVQGPSGSSPR
ncbi:MAG: hypothetical protein R6U39_04780 [Candidatus Aegiribacteria sp.]